MTMPNLAGAEVAPPLALPRRAAGRVFNMVTPLLDRHVLEGRADWPALRLDEAVITYGMLRMLANRAGNALRGAGVEPEQRVALLLPDGAEFVAMFLGAMKIGAVPVPLSTLAPPDQLAYFLEDSRARALVTTPTHYFLEDSRARALVTTPTHFESVREGKPEPRHPMLRTVFVVGDVRNEGEGACRVNARSYEAALAAASPDLEAFPTGVDEPCYWLYSSGTTGPPKGTVHLHGDMLACVTPYAEEVVGIGPDDVTFSVARLFFSYGLVNSLFLPLLAGASAVLIPDRPEPRRVLGVLRRHRPSLFFSVPTSYAALATALEGGENADRPFGSVRLAVSAGEPLPAPLYHRWVNLTGVELLDGIGSTEVGYIFCSNLPGQTRPGSSGVAIGDHRLRIVDEQGRDVGQGVAGELLVRAESTALHYWNRRARSKETFVGEWLRTGDRYRCDADGYYWYLGRTNDVFKVAGQWVSPLEVEGCLLEHPSVLECAVVAEKDGSGLVKPIAYVVGRPDAVVSATDLQAHVKQRLQPHKYPRRVIVVHDLPKTATGKIQRYKLRAQPALDEAEGAR